ncbi:Hypothetical predicted protein [Paramuricea clavata]|uniref:Uncharacterized protein n=1 Tax=Paramuricea clavata TaxID=317549 RepID=A0A6S7FX51_PARCT|nr:Hypothetical predicted protein [Paramuricea clavata]
MAPGQWKSGRLHETYMGKGIRAAWAEGRDWQRELVAFLMNYRTTPNLSTGVVPAEMFYKRVIRSTVPSFSQAPANTAAKRVFKGKTKSKQYVDARRRTRKSTIKEGDTVLVKQKKKNKYTTMFRPQPYKVIKLNVRYSRVTAQRGDHVITRNVSHFKEFSGAYRETVPNPESDDDITIAAAQAGQDNDQDITEDRYPLRANRGVPPDFYGGK